ncbi:hypothetical protein BG60_09195 [Caballeronia zhejiangensis]|uniref:Uncharacterized protein n=2 Tax=Caballeronia zhejiangensis TaxID=871203 RepID=A0A656QFH0_9BURK|nr:hypothetical protein BG58_28545 [Caballeronia jiangsuensis]KDR28884.1 hypothetical protein BG60_09195 [Caballeronia zhejiangensis]SAL57821.1 hypothetical protein AWB71_03154 [Caballeronia peredens]
MNGGKHARIPVLLHAWRRIAALHGREQWRAFYQHSGLDSRLKSHIATTRSGARCQIVRDQAVGVLGPLFSNDQNEFRDIVNRFSSEPSLKHRLHFISPWRAWQTLSVPLSIRDGVVIFDQVQQFSRAKLPL